MSRRRREQEQAPDEPPFRPAKAKASTKPPIKDPNAVVKRVALAKKAATLRPIWDSVYSDARDTPGLPVGRFGGDGAIEAYYQTLVPGDDEDNYKHFFVNVSGHPDRFLTKKSYRQNTPDEPGVFVLYDTPEGYWEETQPSDMFDYVEQYAKRRRF